MSLSTTIFGRVFNNGPTNYSELENMDLPLKSLVFLPVHKLVTMVLFESGEWMISCDLKSEYHHIDVTPHHHKDRVRCAWKDKFDYLL